MEKMLPISCDNALICCIKVLYFVSESLNGKNATLFQDQPLLVILLTNRRRFVTATKAAVDVASPLIKDTAIARPSVMKQLTIDACSRFTVLLRLEVTATPPPRK